MQESGLIPPQPLTDLKVLGIPLTAPQQLGFPYTVYHSILLMLPYDQCSLPGIFQ